MFHGGDKDFIAGLDLVTAETGGHEVDPLSGAANENDLPRLGGVEKALHRNAGLFIFIRGQLAEEMNAAVNIGVFFAIEPIQSVDDDLRFLRRGRVIQVHQRLAVHFSAEDREVFPDFSDIKSGRRSSPDALSRFRDGSHTSSSISGRSGACRPAKRCSSRWARIGSTLIRPMMSLAKAKVSRLRASSRPMPRERR